MGLCPDLDRSVGFQFNCSNYNLEGSECTLFCKGDEYLIGASSIRCESSGRWSADPLRTACVGSEGNTV